MTEGPRGSRSRLVVVALALVLIVLALGAQWWHTSRNERFGRELAAITQPGDIHLLVKRSCEDCNSARAWMKQYGVAFSECDVDADASCAAEMRASGMQGMPLVRVRGELQQGFMPQRIYDRLSGRA